MTGPTRWLVVAFAVAMIAASFGIGWWARRRVRSVEDYFGGTKVFGPLAVSLSSTAAVASAFALVGVPGLIYATGNTISLWMLGSPALALGYFMLGKRVRAMAEVAPVATLGDVSDLRFGGHRGIKGTLALVLFLGCVAYLAAQIKAGAELFAHLLGWPPIVAGVVIFGVLIVYTIVSGEVGGILTQAFQGLVMVVAGVILTVSFFVVTGGFGAVLEAVADAGTVSAGDTSMTFTPDAVDAWGTFPGAVALGWVLIPILGVICQPQVLTRMYALRNPRDLARTAIYGTAAHMVVAFMVLSVGFGAIYLVAEQRIPPLESPDQAIYAFADHVGPGAQLFVYTAVLAAAMSTSSLFLSLAGGIISRDLPSALGMHITAARQITISRATIAVLGICAIVFALSSGDLVAILGTFGYGTLMSATFPVFVLGLLWKGATGRGVFAGLLVALVFNVLALVLDQTGFTWPGGLPWYVNVVGLTVVVSVAVSLLTPAAAREPLDPRVEAVLDL